MKTQNWDLKTRQVAIVITQRTCRIGNPMQRNCVISTIIAISKDPEFQINKLQKASIPYAVMNQRSQSVFFSRNCQVGNANKSANPILNTSRVKKEARNKPLPSFSKTYVLLGEQQ